ncbi:polynucleotide 5'-hydroxyl-kinase NOL9 [Anomaloglossus baeobatrachus]|uniref:polynucleotide 5'-hydroxyl-kinase NOL9 n=1 Tax=Anomaloglossus baeobatrachus TaxID=238106 RepID=UPI003F50941B
MRARGPSYKIRPGKRGSVRSRNGLAERCKLAAAAIASEPHTSRSSAASEESSKGGALLVEEDCRRAVMKTFKSSCSILLLERLEDTAVNYILSHPEYSKMFSTDLKRKRSSLVRDPVLQSIGVYSCDPESAVVISEAVASAAQQLVSACLEEDNGCPIIFVCGPKNVGKSTFNRYLINQLLQHIPRIDYLDCDLGQTEFTPPGCISLIHVTKPVLGPPFTQQRDPHKMVYFGDTTCEQDMERFIESVKYVITGYKRNHPLIINTMGWVKGFGLLLLIDLIHLLSPSHIVQMTLKDNNMMELLTPEYIRNSSGFMTKSQAQCRHRNLNYFDDEEEAECRHQPHPKTLKQHHLIHIESDFNGAGDTNNMLCHNWILRDLAMSGYISKLQQFDPDQIIPLNGLLPYEVPFNSVALRVIHTDVAPSHIMYSVNASWVGLCHILDDIDRQDSGPVLLTQTPICDCLGFGIIRGVNIKKKIYHILTPLPPETLRLVNCLLIGNVSIPHSIFKHQPGVQGDVPYVTTEYDFSIYGSGKIKLKTHLKRREHL